MTANPISLQLYTLRELGSLDSMLDAAKAAGYKAVELLGPHVEDAAATKGKLDERGLVASGAHVSLAALRAKRGWVLDGAKLLGLHQIFMPAHPTEERGGGPAEWSQRGRELGQLARWLRSQGVRLGLHNHNWEFTPLPDGSLPVEHLFEHAGDSLFLELDLAWLVRAGAHPSTWIKRYADRLLAVHVKDLARPGQNLDQDGWADVGAGIIDWKRYVAESEAASVKWLVVEHDKPLDPAGSVKASLDALTRIASA
jgi:sugar phosphate isomerase/epimerase